MTARRAIPTLAVARALALALPGTGQAQERGAPQRGEGAASRELRAMVLELQRQMADMRRQHADEVGELRRKVAELKRAQEAAQAKDEIAAVRRAAQLAIREAEAVGRGAGPEDTEFRIRGLGLQALNPEISVVGDFLFSAIHNDGRRKRSDSSLRTFGIHFESYLDPYTRMKAAVPVMEGDAKLGEAYLTRYGVLPNVNVTLGKFRQQFGVVNRWHKHALDQVDFPMPLRMIFGEGGLNQTGLSIGWGMPTLWGSSQELTFQLTDGENARMFGQNDRNSPAALVHYKNYRDLSKDTYLEFGLTGLVGHNQSWEIVEGETTRTVYKSLPTCVLGADLTLLWEPTERMRYRNWLWRSEAYAFNKQIEAPDGSGSDTLSGWGAYSCVQTKLSRTVEVGVRADYYEPDTKAYADLGNLAPLAVTHSGARRWQVGPYLTWYQSPFVHFRLEYNHANGDDMGPPEDVLFFQGIFAAGPHKHERY